MNASQAQHRELIQAAIDARQQAYAPYSRFLVGAALLTVTGQVVRGANVENASFGLTMCAERVACGAAVAAGHRQFPAIAVASVGGVAPCGACRQVLAQFGLETVVLLVDVAAANRIDDAIQVRETSLRALLPDAFMFGDPDAEEGTHR